MKNTVENIEDYLKDLDDSELLSINREYLENNYDLDSDIYENDEEFFEMFFQGISIMDVVRAVHFGDYSYADTYVKFNGYGNLETTNYIEDFIDISELAKYIHENPESFDIEFDDEEDEDEEE